jgi:hypothetical protein
MQRSITADGTDAFYVTPGRYVVSFGGTPAIGAVVALKGGSGESGSQHLPIEVDGTAIEITGGVLSAPLEIACAGWLSLVTTGYSGSTNLIAEFRRLPN